MGSSQTDGHFISFHVISYQPKSDGSDSGHEGEAYIEVKYFVIGYYLCNYKCLTVRSNTDAKIGLSKDRVRA